MSDEEKEKNKEDIKIKPQTSTLSLLTVHNYNERNKKTKFTSKANNRWIFVKQNSPQNTSKEANNINIKKVETEKIEEEKVGKTLEKWKNLQKTIKEELSLEELMIEKQKQDNSQIKEKFRNYYEIKLNSRKELEKIKNIDNLIKQKDKEKNYVLENNIERVLLDTCEPIKNLLFLLRNNSDYIIKLISLIGENEKDEANSLVELFCNQFYDNILISTQNQDNVELSILVYKLLEDDIISMNSAAIDDFLNDNTFIGKFLTSYVKKDKFKFFFGKLLNPILLAIENKDEDCLDISLANIKSKLWKQKKDKRKSPNTSPDTSLYNENFDLNLLYKDISPTEVYFKKNVDFDEDKDVINSIIFDKNEDKIEKDIAKNENNIIQNEEEKKLEDEIIINKRKSLAYIKTEYGDDLNQEKLINKILNEKDKDMKDFYIHQLEQITTDPDIFTNNGLKNVLSEVYPKDNINILKRYKSNFEFIKSMIDNILQELIDNINTIPYSLKCICKLISKLIYKKFPNLPLFYRNAFIGKFFFDKCIFPILSLDSKNAIINRIFSSCTKKCVNVIVNVLSNANRAALYMTNSDTEKTIFNYYLIEIIPILNKFYEKLIDIKLPTIIEQYLEILDMKIEQNIDNRIFHFKRKLNPQTSNKRQNKKEQKKKKVENKNITNNYNQINENITYDYFKENPEEIIQLQGICFSLQDINYILKLIGKNDNIFKNLPKSNFFNKTVERIRCDDYKLEEEVKKANELNKTIFYVIFKDERNTQLEKIFKPNKNNYITFYSDEKDDKDPNVILKRIKFSIKNILKNKELNFSYLNKATSTDKFFSAIYYELKEEGRNTEILDKVPLKWYSQYIYENKNNLELKYRCNDFQLLYDEIFQEENQKLIELKNATSKIITKNNININCAEDILNKINYSYEDIQEEKKCAKIERFIDTEEIRICMLTSKEQITIRDVSKCDIFNEYHNETEQNKTKNKITCHTHYIKDFINKFSYTSWEKDNNRPLPSKLVKEEILLKDKRVYKIFKTFKDYLDIIKKRIKEPINNKNLFNDITDYNEIVEKIEDYILRQIYKYVYPDKMMDIDDIFEKKTKDLGWITPNMLDIKNISINQLYFTQLCFKNLDLGKSVNDKLNCIREAHASLNNVIKFSNGNESDAGQDEITPVFQYILIKAKPRRIFSNIYYIKTFLDDSELSGSKGFLVTQIESATSYIQNINYEALRMTEKEFNEKMEEWKKLNIK